MALNRESVREKINNGFNLNSSSKGDPESQKNKLVDAITDAIIQAFKDAELQGDQFSVIAGIPVSTAGTPAAQTGATTGPGTVAGVGKLS